MGNNYYSIFSKFKSLGSVAFEQVREIRRTAPEPLRRLSKQKKFAGKLFEIQKDNDDKWNKNEINMSLELKGPNIIRINRIHIYEKKINSKNYDLIITIEVPLNDLGNNLNHFFHEDLCRFYVTQIVKGLEVLKGNEFIHFDIKPENLENLLVSINLVIKISDFSPLRNLKTKRRSSIKIPGENNGNVILGHYHPDNLLKKNDGNTQFYFDLGSIISYLRLGNFLFINRKYKENSKSQDKTIDLFEPSISFIRTKVFFGKDLRYFLIKLLKCNSEVIYKNVFHNKIIGHQKKKLKRFENLKEILVIKLQKSHHLDQKKLTRKENINNELVKNGNKDVVNNYDDESNKITLKEKGNNPGLPVGSLDVERPFVHGSYSANNPVLPVRILDVERPFVHGSYSANNPGLPIGILEIDRPFVYGPNSANNPGLPIRILANESSFVKGTDSLVYDLHSKIEMYDSLPEETEGGFIMELQFYGTFDSLENNSKNDLTELNKLSLIK